MADGLLRPSQAFADLRCTQPTPPYWIQQCEVGLPSWQAGMVYAPQRMSQWCWAACIHMVFAHYGHRVPMAEIVRQAWGRVIDMPGHPAQILGSVNRPWRDQRGRAFRAFGDVYSANFVTAARDLADGRPLIIGSLGHAMVLTAMTYDRLPNGSGRPLRLIVRDPWPGRGRRPLAPREAANVSLLVRITVQG